MAQLIDFNQIMLANLFVSIGNHHNADIDESALRHMVLNTIRLIRQKFVSEYGEIVICADGKNSWRKNEFPYYKANRKKTREESDLDWNHVFSILSKLRQDLEEHFPYKVIHFDNLEADDIIGAICHRYGNEMSFGEQFLIHSSDKDYIQLHIYGNVKQFDPIKKDWVVNSDPVKYLREHILKGDRGDGIPNILSQDNSLAVGIRQKPMTENRLKEFSDVANMDRDTKLRWERNKKLIDLSMIPQDYQEMIINAYNTPNTNGRKKLNSYFIANRLGGIYSHIGDF